MAMMKAHPSVLITRLTEYFECKGDRPIKIGLTNTELKLAEKVIKRHKQRFDASAEVEIKNFGSTDQTASAAIEEGQTEIILSFCTEEYKRRYHDCLADLNSFDEIMSFIKSKVTIPTKEEETEFEFKRLFKCTRIIDENETFTSYIQRLKQIAMKVDGDKNTQLFLVNNVFKKNIASLMPFLKDHNMATKDITLVAEFLDTREKNKKSVLINEINSTNLLLAEMENRLSDKLDEKLERIMALMSASVTSSVNHVAAKTPSKKI